MPESAKPKEYIMYLRKSRYDTDYDTASIDDTLARHKTVLDTYAKNNGLNVVRVFREVASGESISQRPEMLKLLELVSNNEIEGILCMDIDRLARGNSIDQGVISQTLRFTGTKIITPYKTYDPNNEFDEEYMEFGLFMSRKEYKIINRRLERGRKQSASEGRFMGGAAPYGYEMVKLKGEKGNTLKIIPEQADIVRRVFELYCEHGYGYVKIRNYLNENEIPSAKGGKWSEQTIRQMLHNAVYAGFIRSGFKKTVKKLENGEVVLHRVYNPDCTLYPGKHPAIIDKETFDRAHALSSVNTKNKTNSRGRFHYIFSGIMYCAECGSKIKCVVNTREKRPDHRYRVLCRNPECTQSSIKLEEVETTVRAVLNEWLANYSFTMNIPEKQIPPDGVSKLNQLDKEIKKAIAQRTRICELLEQGVYDVDTFRLRDEVLKQKLKDLAAQKVQSEKAANLKKITPQQAIPTIQHLLESWDSISPEEKNSILKNVINRIEYSKPKNSNLKLDIYPNF